MEYKISEDKFVNVIDKWMEFEYPDALNNVTINRELNLKIYRNDFGEVTFKYYYENSPSSIKNKKNTLIVDFSIEEPFIEMFHYNNLILLGKWFQFKTGYPVKHIR